MKATESQPRFDRLIWDGWNRHHIAKHGVVPEEAEQVVAGDPTYRETYKSRFLVVRPTAGGRMLAIEIGPVPGEAANHCVFSARLSTVHLKQR